MEPIEDSQLKNENVSEQPEKSCNSSGCHPTLGNPFEALLQSSSDHEVENELASILKCSGRSSERISSDEEQRAFYIGVPDLDPHIVFNAETVITERYNYINSVREDIWNGFIIAGPTFTTYTKPSELKALQTRNGFGSSSSLSHRLYHSHVWMMLYQSNRNDKNKSDIQFKLMSPVMLAALISKPNIVHFLMKYGIRYLDETHGSMADTDSASMRIVCMRALLSDIITELFENSEVWDSDSLELKTDLSNLPEGLRSKCLNFRLLLRCDPNPYVTTVKLVSLIGPQFRPLPEMYVVSRVYDSVFPDLGFGLFNPPKLQHACRCVIRGILHENWQLPDGISQLELSKILCDYLNLYDD